MRTLFEIIEDAKSNGNPSKDELFYALLALDSASILVRMSLRKDDHREMRKENAHKAMRNALQNDPQEYLGWGNDPANPEYQKKRKAAHKLFDKVMKAHDETRTET